MKIGLYVEHNLECLLRRIMFELASELIRAMLTSLKTRLLHAVTCFTVVVAGFDKSRFCCKSSLVAVF